MPVRIQIPSCFLIVRAAIIISWLPYVLRSIFALSASFTASASLSTISRESASPSRLMRDPQPPPIVYTIAGSDSGGGAGIQADLHAMHALGCHGCSAITCLTAQSSVGVDAVHTVPITFLRQQLDTLAADLPPVAVKIGMLGTDDVANAVGDWLDGMREATENKGGSKVKEGNRKIWVVVDPVMISTSGHKLIDDKAVRAMVDRVLPHADVLTPNKFEAEALLGRKLRSPQDVEAGAKELLQQAKCKSIIIKGGHTLVETADGNNSVEIEPTSKDVQSTLKYAQDYLLCADRGTHVYSPTGEDRMCDGDRGVWLRCERYESENTHGTGCTLSSSIASALALSEQQRRLHSLHPELNAGVIMDMDVVDACCIAKAYISAGIRRGVQLGSGPGPVVHTEFPNSHDDFPSIVEDVASADNAPFRLMRAYCAGYTGGSDGVPTLGRILPIVGSEEWVQTLANTPGISDIQLRIKDKESDAAAISEKVKACQRICAKTGTRLWVNDYWQVAIDAGCFGVHVGQEDLEKCRRAGGLDKLRASNLALGISTHSYGELAVAIAMKPSYISMGPVYATASKDVQFAPQGLGTVRRFRSLIPPSIPFVTIGGIGTVEAARQNRMAGADCVAVISVITKADDVEVVVRELNCAME